MKIWKNHFIFFNLSCFLPFNCDKIHLV
jgi:hypothetical protein